MHGNYRYDVKQVRAPRLRGIVLRLTVALLERAAVRSFLAPWLIRNLGLPVLRAAQIDEPPTFLPLPVPAGLVAPVWPSEKIAPRQAVILGSDFDGIHDY